MSLDKELTVFLKYFRKNKEEVIKYHAIKGAVLACELNDKSDKFYNNSIEAINKLIKHWQNYKKIGLYSFAKEYEELIECQESDVLRAYLGLMTHMLYVKNSQIIKRCSTLSMPRCL